jgi:pimeloyl-ACP methyl ester carboxylesterase
MHFIMRVHRGATVAALAIALAACTTDATRRQYLRASAALLPPPPRPVIIIPGFGVTRLVDPETGRYVWGTGRATMHTRYADDLDLPVGADGTVGTDRLEPRGYVGSRGPVNVGWQLMEGLRKFGRYEPEVNSYAFPYDWRLSARENARHLGALVDRVRAAHGGKRVDVVTHSAGAMIALTWVKLGGGSASVENLVMIAPVQRGVADAFRIFVRPERFLRRTFTPEMVATWPFPLELLPENGRFLIDEEGKTIDADLWDPASWRRFVTVSERAWQALERSLRSARALRDALRDTPAPPGVRISVLAGDCVPTARRALVRRDGTFVFYDEELRPEEKGLHGLLFEPGDGTVPVSSAQPDSEALLFCDGHQGIAVDPNVHRALIRLLHGR